ncbi:hypothetical protein [Microbacterium sp.]|uniref:hypothetical protein n=1 Tax=Microbacterium sp. TaxID=51671 RepID=UPI00092921E6|nr:hypothetical protein [Microbacterium sp.]OJU67497.1 MAG: hypothetical protein BGO04_05740 [Microbacterium sp. 70-38]MBN9153623.1 hypothetical protein [Microbacterium sp.]MBN9179612.1 hypothetical protein [Microbacterium sp.]MBN9181986.1 hypothetical protein [Microbacterium sp.]MBN9185836.1 hypothetical protein [Microbacterium sp.]
MFEFYDAADAGFRQDARRRAQEFHVLEQIADRTRTARGRARRASWPRPIGRRPATYAIA